MKLFQLPMLIAAAMVAGCGTDPGTGPPAVSLQVQADTYRVDTLQRVVAAGAGRALAVSHDGTIVGYNAGTGGGPVVWRDGVPMVLPASAPGTYATDISTDGSLIAGGSGFSVYLWHDGVVEDLGRPALTWDCFILNTGAYSPRVNNAGQVLANCIDAGTNDLVAFLHEATVWTRIGPAGMGSAGYDLAEDGTVVGQSWYLSGEEVTGFSWQAGQLTDLGAILPYAINPRRQMIIQGPTAIAALWTKGSAESIPASVGVVPSLGTFGSLANDGTVLGRYGLWDGKIVTMLPGTPECRAAGFAGPKRVVGWCGGYPAVWVRE